MKFSKEQINYIKKEAKILVDDGLNIEYTRGITELIASVDGIEDVDTAERSEQIRKEIIGTETSIMNTYWIGSTKITVSNIDEAKSIVNEIQNNLDPSTELSNKITDFFFAVESDYQAFYNLNQDDWGLKPEPRENAE